MTAAARTRSQRRKHAALPAAPTPTVALVRAGTADVAALRLDAQHDAQARSVLADLHEESGLTTIADLLRCDKRGPSVASGLDRPDVMRLWLDELPAGHGTRKRVESMTAAETAAMTPHAQRWMDAGLSTQRADRARFEAAVHACYRLSGQKCVPTIVWCPAPIVMAYAGPIAVAIANRMLAGVASVDASVHASVHDSVRDSVHDSVHDSVDDSVRDSVRDSPPHPLKVDCTRFWNSYFGGQFWVGGWGWGNAYATFMIDVLGLNPHVDQRGLKCQAYAATADSACWWYATSHFVIACERPTSIEFDRPPKLGERRQLVRARWDWDGGSWEVTP